jgi:methyl-accepting chemotaxis protein
VNHLTVSRRLLTAFGAVTFIFLCVGAMSLFSSSQLAEADRWNQHTHKVLTKGEAMLLSMVNMETGARGYLLAGDEKFLEPWNAGKAEFEKNWS